MHGDQLPDLDEHAITIAAGVDEVWRALTASLDGSFSRRGAGVYARAVGCTDYTASGPRPLAAGSTLPGFRVAAAVPGSELVLEGRHHFSAYALIFHLEPIDSNQTLLRAESRATFPGVHGGVYRLLVVSSGGHVRAVRHMLGSIKRRSESAAATRG